MEQQGLIEGPVYRHTHEQWEVSITFRGQEQRTFYGTTKQEAEEHMLTYLDNLQEELTKASPLLKAVLGDLFEMPTEQETKPE